MSAWSGESISAAAESMSGVVSLVPSVRLFSPTSALNCGVPLLPIGDASTRDAATPGMLICWSFSESRYFADADRLTGLWCWSGSTLLSLV